MEKNTLVGELSLHYEGYGFVASKQPGGEDIFVPARSIGDALHGDLVEVKIRPSKKGLYEGEILRVVARRLKQIVGRLERRGNEWFALAEDQRVRHRMRIDPPPSSVAEGEYVVAKITQYPEKSKPLKGEVIEKLPKRGTLTAEIEYVIAKHQLPKTFPKQVLESLGSTVNGQRSTVPLPRSPVQRKDLRNLPFVTIDGEDAKDFDDAVFVEALGGGKLSLYVAIADVSHYVSPGSPLDREAFERGTSVYFPGRVLPMLPELLSNNLCSLKPNEDRPVLVAQMEIGADGHISGEQFYSAVFQSHARLTYTLVQKMLDEKRGALFAEIQRLSEAAKRLKARRNERGSLDFDLPEPEIVLDFTGGIENIEKSVRLWAHQIIEELMIAANEAVARFLTQKGRGCLYRVHEGPEPDKIREFLKMVQRLGFRGAFPSKISGKFLQKILEFFKNHPEERLVNNRLLRSLAQAVYSDKNQGHFGLASRCYCHFTSPIRRYPDLVVHRLLKKAFNGQTSAPPHTRTSAQLSEIAEQSSIQERRALAAEREMLKLHQAIFLKDKLGERFEGVISHVAKFGFFVELLEYFVEGLVSVQELAGDQYVFDEAHLALKGRRNKKVFKIGDRVAILVLKVDLPERRVYFKLLDRV